MKAQIIGDIQGPWIVVFNRGPFVYYDTLSLAEYAEIEAFLAENNLERDEQKPDVTDSDSVQVRVSPRVDNP